MNPNLQAAIARELSQARRHLDEGAFDAAFVHLERAHVLGQSRTRAHVRTHALMLELELRRREPFAAFGQLLRLVLGAAGSALGILPLGNTGGSNVGMFTRMPVAPELARIMRSADPASSRATETMS